MHAASRLCLLSTAVEHTHAWAFCGLSGARSAHERAGSQTACSVLLAQVGAAYVDAGLPAVRAIYLKNRLNFENPPPEPTQLLAAGAALQAAQRQEPAGGRGGEQEHQS